VLYVLVIESMSGGLVSSAEVREKLREKLLSNLSLVDPLAQTDDSAFSMFDADDDAV